MSDSEREERFRALYESARRRVVAYALRRTRSPEDAADVVAETFTVAWRRLDDVPRGEEAVLWLYATARRVLANHHRQVGRRSQLVERLGGELGAALRSAEPPVGPDQLASLAALRGLGDDDRELLMLAGWEGLDSAGLARVLGCSRTAARIRLHRARARLSAEMELVGLPVKRSVPTGQSPLQQPPARGTEPAGAERA